MAKRGRKCFGFYPDEQAVVEVIKLKTRTRRGGKKLGPYAISRELNEEGYRTQSGKKFKAQTVKNIIERGTLFQTKKKKRIKKTQLGVEDYLTSEQIAKCRKVLKDFRQEVIFDILLGSGIRASEFIALQVRDLGIFDGRTEIEVKRGKGAKQRTVIIGKRLAAELRRYLKKYRKNAGRKDMVFLNTKGQPLSYDSLYYLIKTIGKRARVFGLHPHTLRHTFATILCNYTENVFFIKDQLGHASLDTTAIYPKTTNDFKLQKMKLFEDLVYSGRAGLFVPENTGKLENLTQTQGYIRS